MKSSYTHLSELLPNGADTLRYLADEMDNGPREGSDQFLRIAKKLCMGLSIDVSSIVAFTDIFCRLQVDQALRQAMGIKAKVARGRAFGSGINSYIAWMLDSNAIEANTNDPEHVEHARNLQRCWYAVMDVSVDRLLDEAETDNSTLAAFWAAFDQACVDAAEIAQQMWNTFND